MKNSKILRKEIVFEKYGKKLVKEVVKVHDGNKLDWYYMDTGDSVVVVPITKEGKVVIVKIYRHNLKKDVYEIPAGGLEGNSAVDAAKRELLEETGYLSDTYIDLGKYYVLPSETNRYVHIVLALDVEKKQEPELDNIIEQYFDMSTELKDFSDLVEGIVKGDSVFEGIEHNWAILLANNYLQQKRESK